MYHQVHFLCHLLLVNIFILLRQVTFYGNLTQLSQAFCADNIIWPIFMFYSSIHVLLTHIHVFLNTRTMPVTHIYVLLQDSDPYLCFAPTIQTNINHPYSCLTTIPD